MKVCVVPGCGRTKLDDGTWCHGHYEYWRRSGKVPRLPILDTPEKRFFAKVDKRPDGCWIWTGAAGGDGRYGRAYRPDRKGTTQAHRLSLWFVGRALLVESDERWLPLILDRVAEAESIADQIEAACA